MSANPLKYSDRIISNAIPMAPQIKQNGSAGLEQQTGIKFTHLMNVDSSRIKDFFYVDCCWLWHGKSEKLELPHTHDFDEVLGLVGTNPDDPYDLGAEVTIWLDDEKNILNRTSLIFLPAGTRHCPIQFNRIDRPLFFVSISPSGRYSRKAVGDSAVSTSTKKEGKPRYTIVSRTKEQFTVAADGSRVPQQRQNPGLKGARVLHLEDDMASGAFYVDFVWLYEGNGSAPAPRHSHEWPELIAMAGCDPEHPFDLGGKMTIDLDGEVHEITKSSLVCIPAGLNHCPWNFIDIKKPTMGFTAGPSGMYTGSHKKDQT